MSILIKGAEMPKNCAECRYSCKHYDCPLVEVPSNVELIDKQAAIKALNSMPTYYDEYEDAIMIKRWSAFWSIKQLPPVTQKQQWVPCSERLPKVKQKVLVQYADGSMATKRCNDAGHLQWFYANAVAWMPAPEPWKGDAE